MASGKEFEALVTLIEKSMNNYPEVDVLHNVKMKTRYGGKRQIDILIREQRGTFLYQTIIECKNTHSRITVNTVGAFKELIESVSAHQGIIVSSKGFQKGAFQSAKEANIFLYELLQVKEIEKHLKEHRFFVHEIKHTSKEVTIRFREKKDINKQISLNAKLFSPSFKKKVSIAEVGQVYLDSIQDKIANALAREIKNPSESQILKGKIQFKIVFPTPLIFHLGQSVTETVGFDALAVTEMLITPSALKSMSEYKDAVSKNVHALIFELESDGETYKLVEKLN